MLVSELVAAAPAPQVLAWMTAQVPPLLFVSVTKLGELTCGIARLSAGRSPSVSAARAILWTSSLRPRRPRAI
jgi:hypothetical protein